MNKTTSSRIGKKKIKMAQAGNAIVMLFAAIGVAGMLTYGLNNIIRGPAVTAAEVSRRTIAENNLVASTRLALAAATKSQANNGDCDGDGFVEPVPYRDAGALPKPTGGGLLPMTIGGSLSDPWNNQYGYCVWDAGTASVSDNIAACGGLGALRLEGSPRDDQPILAVISAGKDGIFQTSCNAYVDTTPADGIPDTSMINKPAGTDDVVLSYTYTEANGIGAGEWKLKPADSTTAEISKNLDVQGGASFTGPLRLQNKGLVLPGDPGDDSVTGICDAGKDQQIRRNTSTSPPTLEICDFANGSGWTTVSGGGTTPAVTGFDPAAHNCTSNGGGPLVNAATNNPGGSSKGGWSDGTYIYLAAGNTGVVAYSYNGLSLTPLATYNTVGTAVQVWGDGTYIYVADQSAGVLALTFNGTAFTLAGSYDTPGSAESVFGTGNKIFVSDDATGLLAFSFASGTFTPAGSYNTTASAVQATTDSNYFYVADRSGGVVALTYDGSAFTLAGSFDTGFDTRGVWTDGAYVYLADDTGGLRAYYFTGTNFIFVASVATPAPALKVWGDGVNLFTAVGASGIRVYSFNGSSFTQVDSFASGTAEDVWGDGVYLYGAYGAGGLYVFTGFSCLSVAAVATAADVQTTVGDPLDDGLVAWWKMNEGTGTTVADSIGTYTGTFVNAPQWLKNGPHGSSGLHFRIVNRDAVQITGLMGTPSAGTISTWVNFEGENGATEVADIFDIGNYVTLQARRYSGPLLETYDGSTKTTTTSSVDLKGRGWHYITATFDDPNNTFRLYIDGLMVTENVYANPIVYAGLGSNTFIGRHANGGTTNDFTGGVDDLRFYNRALSASEVQKLYKRSLIESKVMEQPSYTPSAGIPFGKIAKGGTSTCGIKQDGSLWCWGVDNTGTLGNGPLITANQVSPSKVSDTSPYDSVSTNQRVTCAIRKDGNAYCWGWNLYGQNGRGPTGGGTDTDMPGAQVINAGPPWVQVVSAHDQVCGIKADGTGWSWGSDGLGMLGNGSGSTANLGTPALISGGGKWLMISADTNVACGIKSDRKAYCWGQDGVGQLGNGAGVTGSKDAPTLVDDPGPWSYISADDSHVCGIKTDGSLWCWGDDTNGMLGNGSAITADQLSPSLISREKWIKVEASTNTTCALRADSTIWCWGYNNQGQLGDGNATAHTSETPVMIASQNGWIDMVNSQYGGCAIARDQSMSCWGRDQEGQLGNGAGITGSKEIPTRVENWLNPWAWEWSDNAANLMFNTGYNLALGTAKLQPSATTNNIYFGFTAAGMAKSYSVGTSSHVTLETTAATTSSQLSFKTAPTNAPTDITNNLVGYWPMDDATGSTTVAATYGAAGTVFSSANLTATYGKRTGSASFNADSGQYLRMANAAYLRPASVVLSFWMRPAGTQLSDATIFSKAHTNNTGAIGRSYSAFLRAGHLIWRTGGGGTRADLVSNTILKSNEWVYVTFVMDPAGTAPQKRIYINGVLDNSATTTTAITYDSTAAGNFFIGQAGCATACSFFNGEIDDFRIYSAGLGNPEVLVIYNYLSSLYQTPRSVGIDYSNNNLEFGRNNAGVTNWMDTITSDMTIDSTGNVGVGTDTPQAALDINGGIKVGGDWECTSAAQAGKIRYVDGNGFKWQYCDGSTWTAFGSAGSQDWKVVQRGALTKAQSVGCAIRTDGTAWCWGKAADRTLGNGTTTPDLSSPGKVQTDTGPGAWSDWVQIDSANQTACGVRANGTGWCWGTTFTGELGTITFGNKTRPAQVSDSAGTGTWSDWVWIDSAGLNTCGIRVNGTLWCWGMAASGALGNGTTTPNVQNPVQVKDSAGTGTWSDWIMVDGYSSTNCGIRANGTAWCWGDATKGVLGNGTTTPSVSLPAQVKDSAGTGTWSDWKTISRCADYITCGLRANGTAWCWGNAGYGSLGNNSAAPDRSLPVQVKDSAGTGNWTDWTVISAGQNHTCGVRANGTAWCWGRGANGKLGNGATGNVLLPVQVKDSAGTGTWSDWVSIYAGWEGTCGTRTNGTLWCWGDSTNGQLGNGTTTPNVSLPVQVQ